MLLILEGSDGVGKSTIIKAIKESRRFKQIVKRFNKTPYFISNPLPYPWKGDEEILNQRSLYLNLVETISNDKNHLIISDRSPHSLVIYNGSCTEEVFKSYEDSLSKLVSKVKLVIVSCDKPRKRLHKDVTGKEVNFDESSYKYANYYGGEEYIDTSNSTIENSVNELLDILEESLLAEEKKVKHARILRVGGMPGRGKSTFVDNLVSRLKTDGFNVCHLQEQVGLLLRGNIKSLKRFGLSSLSYDSAEDINKITGSFFPTNETIDQLLLHYDYIVMDFAEYVRGVFTGQDARTSLEKMDKLYGREDVKNIVAVKELEYYSRVTINGLDESRPEATMNKKLEEVMRSIADLLKATLLEDIRLERDDDWVSWFESFMKNDGGI